MTFQLELKLTHYHDFEAAYEARWTVVRMYYGSWNKKSIAAVLKLSQQHVTTIIRSFEKDGFAALEDNRTRARAGTAGGHQWAVFGGTAVGGGCVGTGWWDEDGRGRWEPGVANPRLMVKKPAKAG